METKTKILIIDDNEDDRFFFRRSLEDSGINAEVVTAQDGISGCFEAAQGTMDCIFLDYHLPKMNGLEVLKKIRSMGMDTPIIMLTGQKDEQTIVQLLKEGANDYIPKSSLTSETLRLAFENSQHIYKMRKEKEKAEAALKQSEARLSEAQKIAQIGNWEYNIYTKELFLSDEAREILNYPLEKSVFPYAEFIRHQIYQENAPDMVTFIRNLSNDDYSDITLQIRTFNNVFKHINLKKRFAENSTTPSHKVVGTIQDITVLKKALEDTKKAKISKKATTLVLTIGIFIFILSEAIIDPFVDALQMGIIIAISFKGGIALFLKPLETILEKVMLKRVSTT